MTPRRERLNTAKQTPLRIVPVWVAPKHDELSTSLLKHRAILIKNARKPRMRQVEKIVTPRYSHQEIDSILSTYFCFTCRVRMMMATTWKKPIIILAYVAVISSPRKMTVILLASPWS